MYLKTIMIKIKILCVGLFILAFINSCSSSYKSGSEDLPSWVLNPQEKGYIFSSSGFAKPNALGDIIKQKEDATDRARIYLSKQIETKIYSVVTQMIRTTNVNNVQTYIKSFKSSSTQISNQSIKSSRAIENWTNLKNGNMYVLVVIDNNNIINSVDELFSKQDSLYKELKNDFDKFKNSGKLKNNLEKYKSKEN